MEACLPEPRINYGSWLLVTTSWGPTKSCESFMFCSLSLRRRRICNMYRILALLHFRSFACKHRIGEAERAASRWARPSWSDLTSIRLRCSFDCTESSTMYRMQQIRNPRMIKVIWFSYSLVMIGRQMYHQTKKTDPGYQMQGKFISPASVEP